MRTSKERRKELIRRTFGYMIMISAVLIITTVLFFVMLGYRFNAQKGTIQQGGLVQFVSQPTGAHITVGTAQLARPTKSKITLNPGEYMVKMELDGYQTWQKLVTVEAGKVLWLNSARFVPKEPTTTKVLSFPRIDDTLVRQNGKFMAVLPDKTKNELVIIPTTSRDIVKSEKLTFSTSKRKAKQNYALVAWSSDDRHILLKHKNGNSQEIILVDIDNADDTVIVKAVGNATPVEAMFDPRSSRDMVVRYSDGTVRLVSGGTGKVSKPVLSNIAYMTAAHRSIVYATRTVGKNVQTGYFVLDNSTNHPLGKYATKQDVKVSLRKYYSDYFFATTVGKKLLVQKSTNLPDNDRESPQLQLVQNVAIADTPLAIEFQNNGRLIAIEQPKTVTVYDLELGELATTDLVGRNDTEPRKKAITWLDNQHFWDDATGYLRQYEYDGTNQTQVVKVAKGLGVAYTSDGTYLYSFGKNGKGYVLQRTRMILP